MCVCRVPKGDGTERQAKRRSAASKAGDGGYDPYEFQSSEEEEEGEGGDEGGAGEKGGEGEMEQDVPQVEHTETESVHVTLSSERYVCSLWHAAYSNVVFADKRNFNCTIAAIVSPPPPPSGPLVLLLPVVP